MSNALLTPGFPVSPDFLDGMPVENTATLTPHTESDPFGYQFRVLPELTNDAPITLKGYDPDSQLALVDDINMGGPTYDYMVKYVQKRVGNFIQIDPQLDRVRAD